MTNPSEHWQYHPLGVALRPEVIKMIATLATEAGVSRSEMARRLIDEALTARMHAAKNKGTPVA